MPLASVGPRRAKRLGFRDAGEGGPPRSAPTRNGSNARDTSRLDEIRIVLEGILVQQMIVQATLVDYFVRAGAEEAGWSTEEIHSRLRRIVNFTTIGEVHIVTLSADAVYTSLQPSLAGNSLAGLLCADDLGPLMEGTKQVVDHPTVPCVSDGTPLQVCHGRQRKIATFRAGGSCDRRQFTSVPLIQFHTNQQLGAMQVRWYGRRSTGVEPSGTIRQRGRVNSGLRRTPR